MEMYQVRYFLAVARTLNFTRAAEECEVAQPSLSRAIKQLEAELGGELFRRERPQAILTELGRRMQPILSKCFDSATSAKALAASVQKREAGELRIGLSRSIEMALILPYISELTRVLERLRLIILRGSLNETMDNLKNGKTELTIAASEPSETNVLERCRLFDEDFQLACERKHRFANRGAINLDDLKGEKLILRPHCEHSEHLSSHLRAHHFDLTQAHLAYSDSDALKLVMGEVGVAVIPRSLVVASEVAQITINGLDLRRTVSLFRVIDRPLSAAASTFTNLLRAADWSRPLAAVI